MEQKQNSHLKSPRKRTEQEIRDLLVEHDRQDNTVKEFFKLHDIREWAFYAWKEEWEVEFYKSSFYLTL